MTRCRPPRPPGRLSVPHRASARSFRRRNVTRRTQVPSAYSDFPEIRHTYHRLSGSSISVDETGGQLARSAASDTYAVHPLDGLGNRQRRSGYGSQADGQTSACIGRIRESGILLFAFTSRPGPGRFSPVQCRSTRGYATAGGSIMQFGSWLPSVFPLFHYNHQASPGGSHHDQEPAAGNCRCWSWAILAGSIRSIGSRSVGSRRGFAQRSGQERWNRLDMGLVTSTDSSATGPQPSGTAQCRSQAFPAW